MNIRKNINLVKEDSGYNNKKTNKVNWERLI